MDLVVFSVIVFLLGLPFSKACQVTVDKARLVMKLARSFVICFCSLFLLFVGLDHGRAENTKDFEMPKNN